MFEGMDESMYQGPPQPEQRRTSLPKTREGSLAQESSGSDNPPGHPFVGTVRDLGGVSRLKGEARGTLLIDLRRCKSDVIARA